MNIPMISELLSNKHVIGLLSFVYNAHINKYDIKCSICNHTKEDRLLQIEQSHDT